MQKKGYLYWCIDTAEFTCVPQMTLYSSVFAAPSRLVLAHDNGVDCSSRSSLFAAGKHTDVETLVAARELGMQLTTSKVAAWAAAHCNQLPVIQFTACTRLSLGFHGTRSSCRERLL
jgi:hypothetical protein